MKTQLLQDLQESGSTPPAAGDAVPPSAQPRRKPVVLADETRTPASMPPQRPAPPPDDARTPSIEPSHPPATPADGARTPTDRSRRPSVWHGPAAQRVDAGTPGQRLAPRAARRAPDIAARGAGVAIEAWAERAAQAGPGEARPAPALQPGGAAGPDRPTMDVAAFFGRDERQGASRPAGPESATVAPDRAASSGDSALGHHRAPVLPAAAPGSTQDVPAGAAAVPRRPHLDDGRAVPAEGEDGVGAAPAPMAAPGADGDAPVPVRPAGRAPSAPAHEHVPVAESTGGAARARVPAAQPDDTTLLRAPDDERVPAAQWNATPRASVPEASTVPLLEKNTTPFPAPAAAPVSPWRRLWMRRVVAWSVAAALAAVVGGGAGWLYAGSRDGGMPVAANTVPATAARGAQAYAAREPAPTVKTPPSAAPVEAVKPPPAAEPVVEPAPPAPAPDVAPAASRSVATVELEPPKRTAHHTAPARKHAAAKTRRPPAQDVRPAPAEPSARERREETLMQCRAHGYDERQCIRRGCTMTRYGFVCRG